MPGAQLSAACIHCRSASMLHTSGTAVEAGVTNRSAHLLPHRQLRAVVLVGPPVEGGCCERRVTRGGR